MSSSTGGRGCLSVAGGRKPNPLLAAFEAKLEAEYIDRFNRLNEIDLISHLISCHEDLGVGPGRAEKCLYGFLESKQEVAEAIITESTEDAQGEFCKTQHDLAKYLKSILGPTVWEKHKFSFPMLKDYWDLV